MIDSPIISKLRAIANSEGEMPDDDVMGVVGDAQSLLVVGYATAIAMCTKVDTKKYKWGIRFVFTFRIHEPVKYQGETLYMFARFNEEWKAKHFPESAKLYKCGCIAAGRRLARGFQITKSMFLQKLFKCRLHTAGEGAAKYSTIDMITEKVC
jgi:hypothetical protein